MTSRLTLETRADEASAKTAAARLSIFAAVFLIAIKTATGFTTGSISVWASLLDSAMDVFASMLNYFAVRAAARPADEDHAYGHGKAESLAGLFQALIISASGVFLIWEASVRLLHPQVTTDAWIGVITMLVAMVVSLALVRRLRSVAARTESLALKSDAAHYITDIYTNGGALAALLITMLSGWQIADPLISLSISGYIIWSAVKVGREAIDVLMDRCLPPEVEEQVAQVVSRHQSDGVFGFHDLRTRRSGSINFIDLHLDVDRTKGFEEAHALTVKIIRSLEAAIPRSHVQIHTDPADKSDYQDAAFAARQR